jgi:hypothetical protein
MKYGILAVMALTGWTVTAQGIVGNWQLTDEKTCFQSNLEESETEKELLPDMGGTANAVARIIKFDKKGRGEEGVFTSGRKKGSGLTAFTYRVNGKELLLLDSKSGLMTQQLVIDALSENTLTVHNAKKDCEIKTFTRIK